MQHCVFQGRYEACRRTADQSRPRRASEQVLVSSDPPTWTSARSHALLSPAGLSLSPQFGCFVGPAFLRAQPGGAPHQQGSTDPRRHQPCRVGGFRPRPNPERDGAKFRLSIQSPTFKPKLRKGLNRTRSTLLVLRIKDLELLEVSEPRLVLRAVLKAPEMNRPRTMDLPGLAMLTSEPAVLKLRRCWAGSRQGPLRSKVHPEEKPPWPSASSYLRTEGTAVYKAL